MKRIRLGEVVTVNGPIAECEKGGERRIHARNWLTAPSETHEFSLHGLDEKMDNLPGDGFEEHLGE